MLTGVENTHNHRKSPKEKWLPLMGILAFVYTHHYDTQRFDLESPKTLMFTKENSRLLKHLSSNRILSNILGRSRYPNVSHFYSVIVFLLVCAHFLTLFYLIPSSNAWFINLFPLYTHLPLLCLKFSRFTRHLCPVSQQINEGGLSWGAGVMK